MTDDLEDFFSEGVKWRQKLQGMLLLQNIKFTEHNIEWAYNRGLKSSSSPVPDGRPAELLKQLASKCATTPHIYALSWLFGPGGYSSTNLLLVIISPIHKGGSRGQPANYHTLAHVMQIFDRVLRRCLVALLEDNSILHECKYSF